MMCLRLSLVMCLVMLAAGHAGADQVYFDRSDFVTAVGSPTFLDFEDQPVGPIIGDPWLDLGIVFDEAEIGDNMGIGEGGGYDMNIYALGGQDSDIDVSFPTHGASACGIAVFSNDIQDSSERLIFLGEGNTVLANVEMPLTAGTGSEFVGYVADVAIVRVAFIESDADGDYVGIGEVIFEQWESSPVELASWTRIKQMYSQ